MESLISTMPKSTTMRTHHHRTHSASASSPSPTRAPATAVHPTAPSYSPPAPPTPHSAPPPSKTAPRQPSIHQRVPADTLPDGLQPTHGPRNSRGRQQRDRLEHVGDRVRGHGAEGEPGWEPGEKGGDEGEGAEGGEDGASKANGAKGGLRGAKEGGVDCVRIGGTMAG